VARACGRKPQDNHLPRRNLKRSSHRNQQYSITAVSDGGGSVVERYAYTAYGQVTFADASGSVISKSAIANRYTFTGREWDEGLSLYHYRARMYDSVAGRFCSRDPIGYRGGFNLFAYCGSMPLIYVDADGREPQDPTIVKPEPRIIPVPPDFPDRPMVPTATPPCQGENTGPTTVRICKRALRKPGMGGLGGHIYIRITCGGGATGEWAWSAGPLEPSDKCKDACGNKKQLRTGFFKFLPKQPGGPTTSPEFPEEGETHACTILTIDKSPSEISQCLFNVAKANAECCVPYQGIPGLPGEGCNSNCMAYWMASTCFQPILQGNLGVPGGEPNVATPGWGNKMPKCISDALSKAGVSQ
jgi:RHS repeat-associated protein